MNIKLKLGYIVMNYKESITACITDLMTYSRTELLTVAAYHDIPFTDKPSLCKILALKFMRPHFKRNLKATLPPGGPEYVTQFVDANKALFEEMVQKLTQLDRENKELEIRDHQTIERHVLIALASSLDNSQVLQWTLSQEPDPEKYVDYENVIYENGKIVTSGGLLSSLWLTDSNIDWLMKFLIKHKILNEEEAINDILFTESPTVVQRLLEQFPALQFDEDTLINVLTEAIEVRKPENATIKVQLVMERYNKPLTSEQKGQLSKFYVAHLNEPATIPLVKELLYKTKSEVMNAMARKEIDRKSGIELLKHLPVTLQTPGMSDCVPPEKYTDCTNDRDYITQECWSEETPALLKIKFIDPSDYSRKAMVLCMELDSFKKWVGSADNEFRAWYPNDLNQEQGKEIEAEGYGGKPSTTEIYMKLPSNNYVSNSVFNLIGFSASDYVGYPLYTKKRVGNPGGTFGVSQLHGQEPGETIYYIVPAGTEEEMKLAVLDEIKLINQLKGRYPDLPDGLTIKENIEQKLDKDIIPISDRIQQALPVDEDEGAGFLHRLLDYTEDEDEGTGEELWYQDRSFPDPDLSPI